MARIGYVFIGEYRNAFGTTEHRLCETPRHQDIVAKSVVVIVLSDKENSIVMGACSECFGLMDDDLPPGTHWHLNLTSPEFRP